MKYLFIVLLAVGSTLSVSAQVTKVGVDSLIDIACWNVEWFGNTTSGPSDEALQFSNVKTVIQNTDLDVWGLGEVSDVTTFNTLVSQLTNYDGVNSSFSATQKMAMLWKKSKFDLISFQNLPDAPSFDFASRLPLEVVLKTKDQPIIDTLYFYVVHLKANSGSSDEASYNRRKASMEWLKTFIDQSRKGKKVMVLGDYNDDIDISVVTIGGVQAPTPFIGFINDSADYFFPSKRLSLMGETSYPGFNPPNMIDHHLTSRNLSDSFYVKNSCTVMKQLSTQLTNYTNTTSDHYPVYSRFNFKRYPKLNTGVNQLDYSSQVVISPNPANETLKLKIGEGIVIKRSSIINALGQQFELAIEGDNYNMAFLPNGLYWLKLELGTGFAVVKVQVNHP